MIKDAETKQETSLEAGDWLMAIISFFLTPIVPMILSAYNFTRSRKIQGKLYLGILAIQISIGIALSIR